MLLPAIVSCARPHRSGGLAFSLPFWRWWKTQRRGAAAGGLRPPARCRASPAAGMFWGRGLWPRPQNAAAPRMAAPILPAPPGNRSSAGGEALAKGRVGTLGCAGGRRRFAAWAAKRKKGSRRLCLRLPLFRALCAPAAPPGRWKFRRPFRWSACFYDPKPTHKTSPPLPMSGGPA